MKRLFSLAILFIPLAFFGCEKKENRLSQDQTSLTVTPGAVSLTTGDERVFYATVRSPSGQVIEDALPVWTLSDDALGSLSPQTGTRVTLTASGDAPFGTLGLLNVAYGNDTANAQFWIMGSAYGFYSESTNQGMKLDTPNPPDIDGGVLGKSVPADPWLPYIDIEAVSTPGDLTDGAEGFRWTFRQFLPWGGVFFLFGDFSTTRGRDLSAYADGYIRFDLRTDPGQNVNVVINWQGGPLEGPGVLTGPGDGTFRSLSIPLSAYTGADLSQFSFLGFYPVRLNPNPADFSIYIDNIRLERS